MAEQTKQVRLGKDGPAVFPIGLGCMAMSGLYGAADEREAEATLHAAIDAGVDLVDTGDFYGMGHNEMLVGRALRGGRRERVTLSVKFGALRGPDGAWLGNDTRPAAVKTSCAYSLQRLGVEVIDVYRPARLDPNVPIEETMGAIADLVRAGYVRYAGLSEVGVETIRRAAKVLPIADLQIEYSLASRGPEEKIFPALRELGIGATLYGVFSRGLLTGSAVGGPRDFRAHLPRFAGDARAQNDAVVARLRTFAAERGMTLAQLAVAWARARQPDLVTLVGPKTRAQLADALGALAHPLGSDDLGALDAIAPASAFAGSRYMEPQMRALDSER